LLGGWRIRLRFVFSLAGRLPRLLGGLHRPGRAHLRVRAARRARGARVAREWRMSQDEAVEEGWDWSRPDRPFAIPDDVFVDPETGQFIRPGRAGPRE